MEHSCKSNTHGSLTLFKFHRVFILLCMTMRLESATLPAGTILRNETDRMALLELKKRITQDPLHVMSSWNDSIDFCSWDGVTCNRSTKRVVTLNLEARKLVGSLPPSIGNLTHLISINLKNNTFHGEIPKEVGHLLSLQHLNLSYNSFGGKIPANISHCTHLRMLILDFNEITGSVPDQLRSLLKLNFLSVYANNLTGPIPAWIGNFSSMTTLYFSRNNFQGSIPNDLGRLTMLGTLSFDSNYLSGIVPSSIYNISSMYALGVADNQLHGELPPNVGFTLPNLQEFLCGANKFTGTIPPSLSNASRLETLDFSENGFSGSLPGESLGSIRRLAWLNAGSNELGSGITGDLNFLSFLANCTSLQVLALDSNNLGGELPASIANLSTQLNTLFLGRNLIHGNIPIGIGNLVSLTVLGVSNNYLGGSVPHEIGKLDKLIELYLHFNNFSGLIPSSLGNLSSLTQLYMQKNGFEGSIPPSLGNCQSLLTVDLSNNNLTGTIPKELVGVSSLSISLTISNNSLTGSLPPEVGDLVNLVELEVSGNKLSGEIPATLGNCIMLERLHLEGNEFWGTIASSLKHLRSLEEIDVSRNNLSGKLPEFLGKLRFLKNLNLSYNDFEGELPKEGIFSNASGLSILGNNRLCGGIPQLLLAKCSNKKPRSFRRLLLAPKVVVPVACVLAFILALSCFVVARSLVKKSRDRLIAPRSYEDWKSGVSYSELVQSTNGFSVDNLIGSGSFGSVYKGVVPSDGNVFAIKVLNLEQQGASKSFINECKALRSIRHRNLLKIITACSSIDNHGNDFKSLVFEYMKNGSLDSWLHPPADDEESQSKRLSLILRLNIAIDVASALDYLHHHCESVIVHCDLKPNNVLLDEDMVAHVGDFGLARFLLEAPNNSSQSQTMSAGLKGSIGYIPPEYGMGGQVSVMGDTYSYGILLLEMFTGKRPTDDMFKDGLSINQFTTGAMPNHAMDIVDPSLLIETDDADVDDNKLEECVVSIMHIGLSCSIISPTERMLMNVVVNKLKAARDSYLNLRRRSYQHTN